jgi:hypothetical protein
MLDPLDEIPSHVGRRGGQSQPPEQLGFNSRQDPRNDKFAVPQSVRWRCAGSSVYEAGAPQRDAAESSEKRAFDEGLRAAGHEPNPPMRVAFTDRSVRLADDRRRSWLVSRKEPPVECPEQPRGREKQTGPWPVHPAGAVSGTPRALGHRLHSREEGAFKRRSPSPQMVRRDSGQANKLIHNAGGMDGSAPEGSGGLRDDRMFLQSMGPKSRGHYNPTSPRGVSPRPVLAEGAAGCFTPHREPPGRCIPRKARSCSPVRDNQVADVVRQAWVKDDPGLLYTPQKKVLSPAEPTAQSQRMKVRQTWQQRYCEAPAEQPRRRAGDCSPRPNASNPVTHAGFEPAYKAAIARVNAKSRVQETMDHQGNELRFAAERARRLGHEDRFADLCRHTSESQLCQRQAVSNIKMCNQWSSSGMAAVLSRD